MAVPAYSRWLAAGKPLDPAQPIAELVGKLKAAFPRAAYSFGWYANDAHYMAEPAEDHTPYSQTGWPVPSPEWWVFATDVMHRPDLGVDCNVLFAYWISEARAGRMPWLKYLNWQGKQYRAKGYGGETVAFQTAWANSGHFDHIHASARTDHRTTGLGAWSITPTSGDDMDFNQAAKLNAIFNLYPQVQLDTDATPDGKGTLGMFPVPLTAALKRIEEKLATPAPVTVDAAAVAAALLADPAFLPGIAKAVAEEDHRRSAS